MDEGIVLGGRHISDTTRVSFLAPTKFLTWLYYNSRTQGTSHFLENIIVSETREHQINNNMGVSCRKIDLLCSPICARYGLQFTATNS